MMSSFLLLLVVIIICFSTSVIPISAQKLQMQRGGRVLRLERLHSANTASIDELEARDRARHARILHSTSNGVVSFSLNNSFDLYHIGIYYTKVKVGSPPREYSLLIDTGSEISWISCDSCATCPRRSGLGVELNFYDIGNSTTANAIACSAPMCKCTKAKQCSYTLKYADNSSTSGYFVSDVLYLDRILKTSTIANSSAPIIFGCSTSQFGSLAAIDTALDGILGFDRRSLSIISQLSSRGISPKIFSHCLEGEGGNGGILVLGEILNPSMVYTPLVPSKGLYHVHLQSITVGGKVLHIDPAVFVTSEVRGTIFDSGTTLIHLVTKAYDSVVSAITAAVLSSVKKIIPGVQPCYLISSSFSNNIAEMFPTVTLHFAGGVSMDLRPTEYLSYEGSFENTAQWCIFFITRSPTVTILGDIALKDKSIVYDLARQRIGWANYNCSLPMKVSLSSDANQIIHVRALFHMLELLFIYLLWT